MAPERVRDLPGAVTSARAGDGARPGDGDGARAPDRTRDRATGDAAPRPGEELLREVARKGARRERARREGRHGIGYGLGMFGLVGWSVAIPTMLGIALGVWIDRTTGSPYSWTLMLMLAGVLLGCLNAWYWLRKEAGLDDDDR